MDLQKLAQLLDDSYGFVQRLQVSPGFLLGLAVLLAIAGLLALREAAAWFFKVEDLKRDLARLQETAAQLEGEIRVVQGLMKQAMNVETTDVKVQDDGAVLPAPTLETQLPERSPSFPIQH
jgi:hypothetical protein